MHMDEADVLGHTIDWPRRRREGLWRAGRRDAVGAEPLEHLVPDRLVAGLRVQPVLPPPGSPWKHRGQVLHGVLQVVVGQGLDLGLPQVVLGVVRDHESHVHFVRGQPPYQGVHELEVGLVYARVAGEDGLQRDARHALREARGGRGRPVGLAPIPLQLRDVLDRVVEVLVDSVAAEEGNVGVEHVQDGLRVLPAQGGEGDDEEGASAG
mmetsp:Transcript_42412/g.131911  ORF Transcript_42412/g.131911 Transcript_42412/m.131911 type:complete len:209 (-) Transcript_42412:208-834(-)